MKLHTVKAPNKTAREYQQEICAWAHHNFTYQDRIGLGIAEEIGEFCHHVLKSMQGIRGHASGVTTGNKAEEGKQKLLAELFDAIGDALVYTLHWAEENDTFISFNEADAYVFQQAGMNDRYRILAYLFQNLSSVFRMYGEIEIQHNQDSNKRVIIQRLFNNLWLLAKCEGWDGKMVLDTVWCSVRTRDWIKYPTNGKDH